MWRDTIFLTEWKVGSATEIVVQCLVAWHDFEKDLKGIMGFKRKRGTIFLRAWRDFGFSKIFLFKLKLVPEIRVTIFREKSAILKPQDCKENNFFIL